MNHTVRVTWLALSIALTLELAITYDHASDCCLHPWHPVPGPLPRTLREKGYILCGYLLGTGCLVVTSQKSGAIRSPLKEQDNTASGIKGLPTTRTLEGDSESLLGLLG